MSIKQNEQILHDGLAALKAKIAANITEKGVTPDETSLNTLADSILDISTGGQPGGWGKPADWPDVKQILLDDTTPGYGGKYIQLITDHNDTISLSGALAYRTSDGAFYGTTTATHTWDTSKDMPCSLGYSTRWVIAYTNAASGINLQTNVLWAVLDLTLNSVATTDSKRMLKAFEFVNGKNLAPTLTSVLSMFSNCYSLTRVPDALDLSNVTNAPYLFQNCYGLTRVPDVLNLMSATNTTAMFNNCYSMTRVPAVLDLTSVTNTTSMFNNCLFMKSFKIKGLKVSTNISASPYFTHDDLLYTLQNLQTVTTTETLTLGAANRAKLSDDEIAIATEKGWTVIA